MAPSATTINENGFFIAGLFISLRFERVDNLGAYRIPPETGILIPSVFVRYHPSRALPDARVITDAGSAKSMLEETAT